MEDGKDLIETKQKYRVRIKDKKTFFVENEEEAQYERKQAEEVIRNFLSAMKEHGIKYVLSDLEVSVDGAVCRPARDVFPELEEASACN